MEQSGSLIFSYTLDGKGGGQSLDWQALNEPLPDGPVWVHLNCDHPDTSKWLHEKSGLDTLIIEALLADETRPRFDEHEKGSLIILRGVNLNEKAEPEDMVSVRMWVEPSLIITIRKRRLKAILDIEEKIKSKKGPKNSGEFLSTLSGRLIQRMEPVMSELDDHIDAAEEKVLTDPSVSLREDIVTIRKKTIMLRRYIAPQRDVIGSIKMSDQKWLNAIHRRCFQENYNHITRYVEDLDAIRERAQIVKDELANALTDKLNRNMYILSIVAAIFLPLGFLTGLLGINVKGIPGSENPYAFLIFCGLLSGVIGAQVYIFKKLKWF